MMKAMIGDRMEVLHFDPPAKASAPIVRDLSHVPTETLKSLLDRYQRRLQIQGAPDERLLRDRAVFIGNELGMRLLVADVEKDILELLG